MKGNVILHITLMLILGIATVGIISCNTSQQNTPETQIVEVKRGDLQVTITADGNLVMPHQVKLCFAIPGTVKYIVPDDKKGKEFKAGTLLAKLDDTLYKLAVVSALYDVELALNELAERVYPSFLGYPHYYPTTSIVLRVEQALAELKQTQDLLEQKNPKDAIPKLRVSQYDLEASLQTLKTTLTEYPSINNTYAMLDDGSYSTATTTSPNIKDLIDMIEGDIKTLADVRSLIEKADYARALSQLQIAHENLGETYRIAQKVCGKVVMLGISYPDAATSLDSLRAVESRLNEIQKSIEKGNYSEVEFAKILRMAQHDLEMSHQILEKNDLVFKHGLNLKVLRQYNLALQKYEVALQKSKEELMKTEILSPFDGIVVDTGLKENDQLSAYNYASIWAVHLVDTKWVELDGVVDEMDIFKVKLGQKGTITVDALPGRKLTGTVTFISPFGTEKTGVVNYKVTIKLDPTEVDLKGNLTSTAYIVVDGRKDVLLIPNGAIKGSRGEYWTQVLVGDAKGKIEKRPIVLGMQSDTFSEIVSGIKEGETIIVEKAASTAQSSPKR